MPDKLKFLLINGSKADEKATRNLTNAAKHYFNTVLTVDLDKIRVECVNGKTKLMYKNIDLTTFDACYPRLFSNDFVFGQIVIDILENSNVYAPVSLEGYQVTNHKYYTVKLLSKVGVPVPNTGLCVGQDAAVSLAEKIKYPLVIKLLSGFGGKGVMLAQGKADLKPILETLNMLNELVCTQKFVKNKGEDIRVYVTGNEFNAVKRIASKGEWRTNVSRGGSAKIIDFPEQYRSLVSNSAKIMGMDICTVDLLESEADSQPYVIELNFAPGMIIKFFGQRFADVFMKFIHGKTKEHKMIA